MDIKLGQNYVNFFRTGTKIDKGKSNNEPDKVAEEEKSEQQKPIVPEGKPITASVSDLAGLYGQSIVTPMKPGERIKGEKPDKSGDNYEALVSEWKTQKFPGYDDKITHLDRIIACALDDKKAEWVIIKVTLVHNHQVEELQQYTNKSWDEILENGILEDWEEDLEYLAEHDIITIGPDGNEILDDTIFITDNVQSDWEYLSEVFGNTPLQQQIDILKANIQSWQALKLVVTLKLQDPNLTDSQRHRYHDNLDDIDVVIGRYSNTLQTLEGQNG